MYAYLYFCRKLMPFPAVVEEAPSEPAFTFTSAAQLAPGRDPHLDVVCDGILGLAPLWLP